MDRVDQAITDISVLLMDAHLEPEERFRAIRARTSVADTACKGWPRRSTRPEGASHTASARSVQRPRNAFGVHKVALHQQKLLQDRNDLDRRSFQVRLLDQEPSARRQDARQFLQRRLPGGEMVQRIDNDHPFKGPVGKGKRLDPGLYGLHSVSLPAVPQHWP